MVLPNCTSDEPIAISKGGCSRAGRHAELVEDVAEVAIHGPVAQREVPGDRLVRSAGGDVAEYFEFAPG